MQHVEFVMEFSSLAARRPPSSLLTGARTVLAALTAFTVVALSGCSSPEFNAVREYKLFLENAKPALVAMTEARKELFEVNNPDKMLPLFRDKLLPQVKELERLSAEQAPPIGKLGEIHNSLRETLETYSRSTERLVKKLQTAKEEDREAILVMWGEDDGKFGQQMALLVDELSRYLDSVKN
jgi:hypothetical protein